MSQKDLQEITEYWREKYPQVEVLLWKHEDDPKFHGRMKHIEASANLSAETIGELIAQGENFLREFKR